MILNIILGYLAAGAVVSALVYLMGDDEIRFMYDSAPSLWVTNMIAWPRILWAVLADLFDSTVERFIPDPVIVYDEDKPLREGEVCWHFVVTGAKGRRFLVHLHMPDDEAVAHEEAKRHVNRYLAEEGLRIANEQ